MAKQSTAQKRTVGRVMHEFKHGELARGTGGKVKSRKQAVAIALKESGSSKFESKRANAKNLARTKRKEARGETAQQEREGRASLGARGKKPVASRTSRSRGAAPTKARRKTSHGKAR